MLFIFYFFLFFTKELSSSWAGSVSKTVSRKYKTINSTIQKRAHRRMKTHQFWTEAG